MSRASYSPAAAADINEIWDYSAGNWGPDQADRYTDGIRDICIDLASGTRTGRQTELRAGLLKHPAGRHMVYYRQTETGIDVIRILHQSMDIDRHL